MIVQSARMIRCQESIKTTMITLNKILIRFYQMYKNLFPHLVKKNQNIRVIDLHHSIDEMPRIFQRNALTISSIIESIIMTNDFKSILSISKYFRSMLQEEHDEPFSNQSSIIEILGTFRFEKTPFLVSKHHDLDTFEKNYRNVLENTIRVAIERLKLFLFNYAKNHYIHVSGLTDTYIFPDEILNGVVYNNRYNAKKYRNQDENDDDDDDDDEDEDEDEGKTEEGDGKEEKEGYERKRKIF